MSVDGAWNVTMSMPQGERKATLTLKSSGAALTGTETLEGNLAAIFDGTVNGDDIAWKVSITEPKPQTLGFSGRVSGDSMTGEMDVGPMGSFPFKATRDSPFGTFGRCKELPLDQMPEDQRQAYELVKEARGTVPGPYKIWLQNLKLTKVMVPLGVHYQHEAALTKAEMEIATNLANAKWLAAYSNYEHEWIAELLGGLPAEKVEALIAGLPTSFDDPRQQVVYEMTSALLGPRVIPRGLYQRAVDLLGHAGLTDLIALIGYFTTVSLTLRAYDVPSDAEGLER